MRIEDLIIAELRARNPARLLTADEAARMLVQAHLAAQGHCTLVSPDNAADLAIAFIASDLNKAEAGALIGSLQRRAPVVMIAAGADSPLEFADFLSFGMQRLVERDEHARALYLFDLHTYKPAPDWLNSRFWANPQRWKP